MFNTISYLESLEFELFTFTLQGRKDGQKRAGAVDIMGLGSPSKSSKQPDVLVRFIVYPIIVFNLWRGKI